MRGGMAIVASAGVDARGTVTYGMPWWRVDGVGRGSEGGAR